MQRNDAMTYFACSSISRHWELFFQNRSWSELFPPIVASMFVEFKRNLYERYRDILGGIDPEKLYRAILTLAIVASMLVQRVF